MSKGNKAGIILKLHFAGSIHVASSCKTFPAKISSPNKPVVIKEIFRVNLEKETVSTFKWVANIFLLLLCKNVETLRERVKQFKMPQSKFMILKVKSLRAQCLGLSSSRNIYAVVLDP